MDTIVSVGRMDHGSTDAVARLFAEYDAAAVSGGLIRRQLYSYNGLFIHLRDLKDAQDDETGTAADRFRSDLATFVHPLDGDRGAPRRFYLWQGTVTGSVIGLHSTIVVNRMAPKDSDEVAGLFAELDATDFPVTMGTRRRQLFSREGIYFHIQDFERVDGFQLIDKAWRDSDPRFIKICDELENYIDRYDPQTYRTPADAIAARFYEWTVAA
ncbi:TcmI family type II polyketide cyclase [Nocardia sp. NPDC051030]|uniref:TcmI family type II polyketide cyclase n=1 Tax=Nocardia sp. NPDC051030 TaxID=3155162 RepID=UPI003448982A